MLICGRLSCDHYISCVLQIAADVLILRTHLPPCLPFIANRSEIEQKIKFGSHTVTPLIALTHMRCTILHRICFEVMSSRVPSVIGLSGSAVVSRFQRNGGTHSRRQYKIDLKLNHVQVVSTFEGTAEARKHTPRVPRPGCIKSQPPKCSVDVNCAPAVYEKIARAYNKNICLSSSLFFTLHRLLLCPAFFRLLCPHT